MAATAMSGRVGVRRQLQNRRPAARKAAAVRALPVAARADYLGSMTNLVMVANVTAFLTAGRFGLAPATNRPADAGLKLSEVDSGLMTGDPAGFTAVDVLAFGSMGHVVGIGMVLGLKATGQL